MTLDKYLFFSGDKPTIEDENFSRNALIQAVLDRTKEFFTDGVFSGLAIGEETEGEEAGQLVVFSGAAYRGGERIALGDKAYIPWPDVDSYVFAGYTLTDGSPKTHHVTGDTHQTRRVHATAIRLAAGATPGVGEVLLGRAFAAGGVEDLRTFAQVVSDPRMHQPNTDTHTTAAEFRVGFDDEGSPGSEVLTALDAIAQQPELQLLFRSGILNLQDGHGDRLIETRKIPSRPGTPVLDPENLLLTIHGLAPDRDAELRSALDSHTAAQVSVDTLAAHLVELTTLRRLVNAKRLLGYTLPQIQGFSNVGASPDLDVRAAKNQAIVSGAGGATREPGTLSLLFGSAVATGTGTTLAADLAGKRLLLQGGGGTPYEVTVLSVDVGAQTLTLTATAAADDSAAWFYLADVASLGYDAAVSNATEMLAAIDGAKDERTAARSEMQAVRTASGARVLDLFSGQDAAADESYSLQLTWDKPALVDLEEIRSYSVRIYELKHTRSRLPAGIGKATLESAHAELIHRTVEIGTIPRRRSEGVQASDTTDTGSTVSRVKVAGPAVFQVGTRVEVGGVSRVIRAFDSGTRTIELLTPLPAPPASGVSVTSYSLAWDGDVWTERLQLPIRAGQHLVIYVQALSEHDVVGDWSDGLVVRTDTLEDADGVTLAERVRRLRELERGRFGVERDQVVSDMQEQVVALQQALASAPTQEQLDSAVAAIEELQASA